MRIIDITGTITNGMWTYGPPFPDVRIEEIPQPPWCPFTVHSWKFSFAGQTGTYLQTGLKDPQYVFDRFFEQGTLLLAPVVNLTQIRRPRVKLTVLPLKVAEAAHAPARAIVIEE